MSRVDNIYIYIYIYIYICRIKFCMLLFHEFQLKAFHTISIDCTKYSGIYGYLKRRKIGNFVTKIQQDEFKCGYWKRKEN